VSEAYEILDTLHSGVDHRRARAILTAMYAKQVQVSKSYAVEGDSLRSWRKADQWRTTEVALKRTADLARVRSELDGWDVVIEATGFAIHIMDPGHGKMAGVRKMTEIMDIDISQVAAFGVGAFHAQGKVDQCWFAVNGGIHNTSGDVCLRHGSGNRMRPMTRLR